MFNGKIKAVTFSYDDGVVQDIHFVELLNKYNLKCTFNINSGLLGRSGFLPRENQRICHYKVHKEDVKKIYEGHEVAVHTLTHPNLTTKDDAEVIRQVEEDRKNLSELVGYDVVGMAFPCGGVNHDERVIDLIKNNTGVKYCRTIDPAGNFDMQDNLYRYKPSVYHLDWDKMTELAEKFIELETDKPQVFYIWGHTYELDYDTSYWAKMEDFFKLISNRDDIFYGTNTEIIL